MVKYAKSYLDQFAPLKNSNWDQIKSINLENNKITFKLLSNDSTVLKNENQIVGISKNIQNNLNELILVKNNLHCRIIINNKDAIGKEDPAGISDIIFESAISTILDCEDSVATVDADDKVTAYRNWLGLMKGDLESTFTKNEKK